MAGSLAVGDSSPEPFFPSLCLLVDASCEGRVKATAIGDTGGRRLPRPATESPRDTGAGLRELRAYAPAATASAALLRPSMDPATEAARDSSNARKVSHAVETASGWISSAWAASAPL